jgi:guanylate kinase
MSKLISVCGPYGAGKTTLVRAARRAIPSLEATPTYVTRPPRADELTDNQERLSFVSQKEYDRLRRNSTSWDHTEIIGVSYGTDAALINNRLAEGQDYIICAPADVGQLKAFQSWYRAEHLVVWLNTDLKTANQRLRNRDGMAARTRIEAKTQTEAQMELGRNNANTVFQPSGNLKLDVAAFIELIRRVLLDKA